MGRVGLEPLRIDAFRTRLHPTAGRLTCSSVRQNATLHGPAARCHSLRLPHHVVLLMLLSHDVVQHCHPPLGPGHLIVLAGQYNTCGFVSRRRG